MIIRKAGDTSNILQIFIEDSTSTNGAAGLTGLAYNTSSLVAYFHRDTDTTATAITLATMTVGTFASGGFKEIDATHMPGWYQFCPPDAALAAGAKYVSIMLKGATNMAQNNVEIQLIGIDVQTDVGVSVWEAARASHTTSGSFGEGVASVQGSLTGSVATLTANNDKTGYALSSAGLLAIWNVLTSLMVTAGSVGAKIAAWVTGTPQTGDCFALLGTPAGASVSADIAAVQTTATGIKAKTDNLPASPAAVSNIPTVAQNAAGLLDAAAGVETNLTVRQGLRLMVAALAGKLSGAATTTVIVRDTNDTKNRITATVDANGNRSAMTYDES